MDLTVLTVLVGIIALAAIIQSISLLIFVLNLRKFCERMETIVTGIANDIQPVLSSARELVTESREKVGAVTASVLDITEIVKGQVTRLDSLMTDASDRIRLQLIRVDHLVDDTVTRVEETTVLLRQSVLGPVREITAILTGVRTAVDVLFRRNKREVERAAHDEEMFI